MWCRKMFGLSLVVVTTLLSGCGQTEDKTAKEGLQIHVHAIGDAAIRRALNGFEAMRNANGMSDNRHQIVHLQLIHPDDRLRFGELNIRAVFQSLWAYPDPAAIELDVPMLGEE